MLVEVGVQNTWLAGALPPGDVDKLKVAIDKQNETPKATQVPTMQTGIDCRRIHELLQNPVARATVRIVRRGIGPIEQRSFCSGFLLNSQGKTVITTAAHCFYNRRTGAKIDPKELAVGLIDETEFPIKNALIQDYDIKTGGRDFASVETFDEISFKNFENQCVKKQEAGGLLPLPLYVCLAFVFV